MATKCKIIIASLGSGCWLSPLLASKLGIAVRWVDADLPSVPWRCGFTCARDLSLTAVADQHHPQSQLTIIRSGSANPVGFRSGGS